MLFSKEEGVHTFLSYYKLGGGKNKGGSKLGRGDERLLKWRQQGRQPFLRRDLQIIGKKGQQVPVGGEWTSTDEEWIFYPIRSSKLCFYSPRGEGRGGHSLGISRERMSLVILGEEKGRGVSVSS